MKLTPLDIRHREFKRGMRGYHDAEVDEFLDEVADEYERLFKENIDLGERVESLEEKVAGYKRIEETLQKTLVNAQASAEEQKQNAAKEAQLILQDAELKARQLINEAYSERQAIEQSMAKLRSAEEGFRFKFQQLLEGHLRQLHETPEATAPTPVEDLTRHTEAIKAAIVRESAPERSSPSGDAPAAADVPDLGQDEAEKEPQVSTPGTPQEPSASDDAPRPFARPGTPVGAAGTPSLGPGGVQAGARRPSTPQDEDDADDPEITASTPVPADEDGDSAEGHDEPVVLDGEDDLLADVDTGVNEDEFNW